MPRCIQRAFFLLFASFINSSFQDIYMHNPRGSNNRLNERSRPRANGDRLFDSQNNDRGGNNVGEDSLAYVEGSNLQIEWTLQHACGGGSGVNCEVIIQYACGNDIRDGTVTATINQDGKDHKFGLHETAVDYKLCKKTKRNENLFVADQKLKGRSARFTRQNPNGQRRGLECPEERDYYPYWRPSRWRDVAIMTNDVTRCENYLEENSRDKWECLVSNLDSVSDGKLPLDAEECGAIGGSWEKREAPQSHLICRETEFSRDNHLGNSRGGQPMSFNWTIPPAAVAEGNCVLRLRYNVSTGDYDGWEGNSENVDDQVAKASGFEQDPVEAQNRGFKLKVNPIIKIFEDVDFDLELAVNTAQFGRVFQDRSHVFKVISREKADVPKDAVVHNLNVRGRRGNIVQVYPSVEYDFIPNTLMIPVGDYIHIQWTGSDSTPAGDGQGKQSTDRSNILLQREYGYPMDMDNSSVYGNWGVNYPSSLLKESDPLLGLSLRSRRDLAFVGVSSPGVQLDEAPAYFDLKPRKLTHPGAFHFFSTRNNNFSNRNQKGRVMVVLGDVVGGAIGSTGGSLRLRTAEVVIDPGALKDVHQIRAQILTEEEFDEKISKSRRNLVYEAVSPFLVISPEDFEAREDERDGDTGGVRVFLNLEERALGKSLKVLSSRTTDLTLWKSLPHRLHQNNTIEFSSVSGGVFYIGDAGRSNGHNTGIILGVIVSLGLVLGLGCYILRRKRSGHLDVAKC